MSSTTIIMQAEQPTSLSSLSNEALISMQNMLIVAAQSNAPLLQEIQRTHTAFQRFMEGMQTNVETLVQENAQLRRELIAAESRLNEAQRIRQVENQAHQAVLDRLSTQFSETNNRLATLENGQTAIHSQLQTVNRPDLEAIRTQHGILESRMRGLEIRVKTEMNAKSQQLTSMTQQLNNTTANLEGRIARLETGVQTEMNAKSQQLTNINQQLNNTTANLNTLKSNHGGLAQSVTNLTNNFNNHYHQGIVSTRGRILTGHHKMGEPRD